MGELNLIGKVLDGRYRVDSELGAGGMATAYLAYEESLDRQVVVKVPDPALLQEESFRKRFHQEIRSLTKLRHPRVVSILAAGDIDGVPYAVMDYLEGGSLRDRMNARRKEDRVQAVLDWLPAIAEALDFMHEEGVVHRDVKPGNILFDGHDNPFLSDFGIAKALGSADTGITRTGTTVGTAIYMAPEQGLTTDLAGAADQYALGVIVYEELTGRPPIEGETAAILLVRKVTEPPAPIVQLAPDLPPGAAEAVMRALQREVDDRFATCSRFAMAFAAAFSGDEAPIETAVPIVEELPVADATGTLEQPRVREPVPAPPVAPTVPTAPAAVATKSPVGRRIAWWAAALVGVVALIFGLRFATRSGKEDPEKGPRAVRTAFGDLSPSETLVREAIWRVSGHLSGPGAVSLNGDLAVPDESGRFEARTRLEEGPNLLVLKCLDSSGAAVQTLEYRVTLDSQAPTVRIDAPTPDFLTANSKVELAGVVSDVGRDHVVVDGRRVEIRPDGAFRIELSLAEGSNRFSVHAVDRAGNRSSRMTVTCIRDGTHPILKLGSAPSSTTQVAVELVGTISEAGCTITANGRPARVKGRAFSVEVPLDPGANLIELRAEDRAGNGSPPMAVRITRREARDSTPPTLRLGPAPSSTALPAVVLKGTVSENGCTVTANGRPAEVKGRDFYVKVSLVPGANLIEFRAEDREGNVSPPVVLRITRYARKDDSRVEPPVAEGKVEGSWILDVDATRKAYVDWMMGQIDPNLGPRERRMARQEIEMDAAEELGDLRISFVLRPAGALEAVMASPDGTTRFTGRWGRRGKELTLTLTHEDGERQPVPEVLRCTPQDGRLVVRGDELPFGLVMRRPASAEGGGKDSPRRPEPLNRMLAGLYLLDADRTARECEKLFVEFIEREYGRLTGVEREQAVELARREMEEFISNLSFQFQLSSDGSFNSRAVVLGNPIHARGTWATSGSIMTVSTKWKNGQSLMVPEVQTARIADGRLYFRLAAAVPLEIVLKRP